MPLDGPKNRAILSVVGRASGFKTFIVSGGGVEFIRPWTERFYGVPPEQVVGSSIKTRFQMRDGRRIGLYKAVCDKRVLENAFQNDSGMTVPLTRRVRDYLTERTVPKDNIRSGKSRRKLRARSAATFIEFPPMQRAASFNLDAVKAEIEERIKAMKGRME